MSVGILLISHPGVGSSLLHNAVRILGNCPLRVRCLEVPVDGDTAQLSAKADDFIAQLDHGDGVLILNDLYGATPSNIGCRLGGNHALAQVSGINLPMLVRVMNYAHDDLDSLCRKAVEGGTRGIQVCDFPKAVARN